MSVEMTGSPVMVEGATESRGAVMDAIVGERAGVLSHARMICGSIDKIAALSGLSSAEASFVKRVLRNFANDIAIGFHVEGEWSPELRTRMREVMEAARG